LRVFQEKKNLSEVRSNKSKGATQAIYPRGKHDEEKKIKIVDQHKHIYNRKIDD